MGRDLFDSSDAARKLFEQADDILGYAVTALCFEGPEARLQETQHAQPAIFVTSVACLEAARERGVVSGHAPTFVAGHSLGEYTALYAAGAMTFEDGLRLVKERGRLMQEAADQQAGTMAVLLGLEEDAVADICKETGAEICNLNAPGQIVIGGAESAVEAAMALALERGARRSVQLKVGGAFHTSFMEPAAEGMERAVADTPIANASPPVVANTTGEPLTDATALREELVLQLVRPVQWQRSMTFLAAQGVEGVVEFGPRRVLTGLVRRIDKSIGRRNVSGVSDLEPA
jgi:[acyl-carrier-protein] S-malonyltransferase